MGEIPRFDRTPLPGPQQPRWIIPHANAYGKISYFPAGALRAANTAEFTQDRTLPAILIPGIAIRSKAAGGAPDRPF